MILLKPDGRGAAAAAVKSFLSLDDFGRSIAAKARIFTVASGRVFKIIPLLTNLASKIRLPVPVFKFKISQSQTHSVPQMGSLLKLWPILRIAINVCVYVDELERKKLHCFSFIAPSLLLFAIYLYNKISSLLHFQSNHRLFLCYCLYGDTIFLNLTFIAFPVVVNLQKVKDHLQLSPIVCPVTCTSLSEFCPCFVYFSFI